MINIFTKSKKVMETVMIDRTVLSRYYVTMICQFSARRRAGTFSATILRSNGKHGEIERKNTFVTTSVFSRTIHERKLRSLLRKVFYERDSNVIYVRYYVKFFSNVACSCFTFVTMWYICKTKLRSCFTFVTTYSVELNVSHGLRSPFNWHERSLGTECGTNVELAVTKARSNGTVLFYHLFNTLMNNGWMFFRISPWESLTAKTHVVTARKARTWIRFSNALHSNEREKHGERDVGENLRSNERGVMNRETP